MPARPLVGIPTYHVPDGAITGWTSDGFALPSRYVSSLLRAGAQPVLLPACEGIDADEVLAPLSGLLLAGGGDIEPIRYGGQVRPEIYGVDPGRDAAELLLLAEARRRRLPVLGICRGFQLVNVAAGGTLLQHLPDEPRSVLHGQPISGTSNLHPVDVDAASRLAGIVGGTHIERCLSHHHQGIDHLGAGLRPVAWSADGLIEAVEPDEADTDRDGGWLVAVQWHPEMTADVDPVHQALFDQLVAAAAEHDRVGSR